MAIPIRDSFSRNIKYTKTAAVIVLAWGSPFALAQDRANATPFELGTVVVMGTRPQVGELGDNQVASVVTRNDMQQFNRDNVADALNLLSGVTISNTDRRNEKLVFVRGFDSRQVPLFIDGIPVYVPYDGNVDMNRFTTADLAAIQVAKGFSSVAYGANALGGAINLISRKPKAQFEGEAKIGFATGNERQAQVNVGSNQGNWYLQAGASYLENDNFRLSSDFKPTKTEDGGARNNSYRKDDKLSFKVGLTPNKSDEYSLSYYKQDGEKGQPPSTDPAVVTRYWKWPYWNKESLYFISRTSIGSSETLKFRLYHDSYDNEIDTYTNSSYTTLKTSGSGSVSTGRSIYNDKTNGGSIELDSTRFKAHSLRFVAHYKADEHKEIDAKGSTNAIFKDELVSYAAEDNIQLDPALTLSLGVGQHQLRPDKVFSASNTYQLPGTTKANNAQAGLFYDWTAATSLYATLAKKTRLPTLKDRYTQALGTFIENPDLQPEESINYEVGYKGQPWKGARAEAAIFYSSIRDKIQSALLGSNTNCTKPKSCQWQNIGKVHAQGIELGLRSPVNSWMELGGNYTLTEFHNISNPSAKMTNIPQQKLTAHVLIRPTGEIDLIAFAEYDSSRWDSVTFARVPGFTTMNLKAAYHGIKNISAELGVTNLADRNYSMADGFPNPGRMWFANASYQF
jgi:iron complex outermembrane receptor protein